MVRCIRFVAALLALAGSSVIALAAEDEYKITIENHAFAPMELKVPAEKKIKLVIENLDSTPEEFESYDLNREKLIGGRSKSAIYIGPLKPGRYAFFGEFHPKSAQGAVVAE